METVHFTALGAQVTGYVHELNDRLVHHRTRPAVIICAGGAYEYLSPREKDPAALYFVALGYQAFLLEYDTGERAGGLLPLRELAETVKTVRAHAREWCIEENRIAVMGFSAGGHLACSLGVLWDREELSLGEKCRPDALILCYPVITMGQFAHAVSRQHVTGGDPALTELLSLENQVRPSMPPTFIWHCAGDQSVPVENAILLVSAMQREHVPYECHLFSGGVHGMSMCTQEVETLDERTAAWAGLAANWINSLFSFVP